MKRNQQVVLKEARREIVRELVAEYGEAGVREKAKDPCFVAYVNDLAIRQTRQSTSSRDISFGRLRKKKKKAA